MIDYLSSLIRQAREHYPHGLTAGLGVGWMTQAVEVIPRVLGVAALASSIYFSYARHRREDELHKQALRELATRDY